MAPCNGTQQQHHVHSPKVGRHPPPNHSTLQWLPTMAPSNGTLRLHPAMAPRPLHPALAPWCHVQSAKVVRRPPPLLEVRTPIAIAIWGMNRFFFHWHRGWLIPPLQSTPPRLVLRGGHRLVKIPEVSLGSKVGSPWGDFTQPSPPLGRSRKKKFTQHLENWIPFCWISIGFVLLVIFFFGGGGGAGDRPVAA